MRGRKSRHGAFLITQIYTRSHPLNEEPSECSEQGKPGGKAVAREPRPSFPLLTPFLSVERRNLPVFLAPLQPPRTKCYPCSLTLISRMQYNREHNLEIARIIPATGLIKACMQHVRLCACVCTKRFTKRLTFNYSFRTEK